METKSSIQANYIEMYFDGNEREYYIDFKPPVGKITQLVERKAIVVVDCSGSMSGSRIAKANKILEAVYAQKNLSRLEVIKFGSQAQGPLIFDKNQNHQLTQIKADLGGTDFVCAINLLLTVLQAKTVQENYFVIFTSDGEAPNPTNLYEPLQKQLKKLDIPLFSVAISTNVDPEIMVQLANLNGDHGLTLIKDSQVEDEYLDSLINSLPVGSPIDQLSIVVKSNNNKIIKTTTEKYKRDADHLSIEFKTSASVKDIIIEGELENNHYTLELNDINKDTSFEDRLEKISMFIQKRAKSIIGKFIIKELPVEEAKKKLTQLKELYMQSLDENKLIEAIIKENSSDNDYATLSQQGRIMLKKIKQLHKSFLMSTLQQINNGLDVVESNDLRKGLEAYSGKVLSAKFNKRIQQIALKNQSKKETEISTNDIASYLSSDTKPFIECVYWLQNPLDVDQNQLTEIEQNEWVGNGVLAQPHSSAVLSPWNIDKVIFRPIKITNTVIPLIKVNENPRHKTIMKGFEGEFNTSLPLLSPEEHKGAVRLIIEFMRKSTPGQKLISKIFSDNENLFDPAMVNAIYVAGILNTLANASTTIEFELAFKAFLTMTDQVLTQSPLHSKSSDYWGKLLDQLLNEKTSGLEEEQIQIEKAPLDDKKEEKTLYGNELIANKDAQGMPNIIRAFIPLVCTEKAYEYPVEKIKNLFSKLFARLVVEQSSQKYQLDTLLGLSFSEIQNKLVEFTQDWAGQKLDVPKLLIQPSDEKNKFFTNSLRLMYFLHMSIRNYLTSNKKRFEEFFKEILSEGLNIGEGVKIFQNAQMETKKGTDNFVQSVFETQEPRIVTKLILIIACQNHVGKILPIHDGNDIKRVLESYQSAADLPTAAQKVCDNYVKQNFGKVMYSMSKLLKKKKKILKFIQKAQEVNKNYKLERLEFEFQNDSLSFSNHHDQFPGRKQMFNFLKYWSIRNDDLESLKTQNLVFFKDFDLEKWIKQHRGFLPGFSKFYKKNLEISSSKADFVNKMQADLEIFYKGENGQPGHQFTERMKEFLPDFVGHFWEEKHLISQIKSLRNDKKSQQETLHLILQSWSELKELDGERREDRIGHIGSLVEKLFKE